jgi:hypothetical protein
MKTFILQKREKLSGLYRKHGKKVFLYLALYLIIKWSIILFLGSRIVAFFS